MSHAPGAAAAAAAAPEAKGRRDGTVLDSVGGVEVPINFTQGASEPVTRPDSEYPSWLFDRISLPNRSRLDAMNSGGEEMDVADQQRHWKLQRRLKIKESNIEEQDRW